jgi:hypothetical protein
MSHETLKWKLFPFSLMGIPRNGMLKPLRVSREIGKIQNKFYIAFFPESRLVDLRMEVLGFRQKEKETLGVAWARLLDLNMSGPNLELSEPMLL